MKRLFITDGSVGNHKGVKSLNVSSGEIIGVFMPSLIMHEKSGKDTAFVDRLGSPISD